MSTFTVPRKQLVRELRVLAIVQIIVLCVAGLGLFLFGSNVVPNDPDWDTIHSLCGLLAISAIATFLVAAAWGWLKLFHLDPLPFPIRFYLMSVVVFLVFLVLTVQPKSPHIIWGIFSYIFPCYSIIPQFVIARWLAKETKDDTIENEDAEHSKR